MVEIQKLTKYMKSNLTDFKNLSGFLLFVFLFINTSASAQINSTKKTLPNTEYQIPNTAYEIAKPNTKNQKSNTQYQKPNTKHQIPNTETPNTQYQTPKQTEYRIPNRNTQPHIPIKTNAKYRETQDTL